MNVFKLLFKGSLILRIFIGVILAVLVFYICPPLSDASKILGSIFVTLLRSIAPFLVFVLLMSAICRADSGSNKTIKAIVFLYIFSSLAAALIAAALTIFAPHIHLNLGDVDSSAVTLSNANSALDVLRIQLVRMLENPVSALVNSNYMAVLAWAVAFGISLRAAGTATQKVVSDFAEATTRIVSWIVQLAPIGVYGIFSGVLVDNGIAELVKYGQLIVLLLVAFAIITFIYFPVVGFLVVKRNPLPLLFKCLAISGVPAFFSRSSAANIPVNMEACRQWGLPKKVYSFTIPLGANINLTAASATISVLSITAALSLGVNIHFTSAFFACVVAALCGLGASGIPGGSLLMIPIAASLFGVTPEQASQMIAIGFLIGIVQDSVETAINSAGDLYYTSLVCEKYHSSDEDDYSGIRYNEDLDK